jgi:flotillin
MSVTEGAPEAQEEEPMFDVETLLTAGVIAAVVAGLALAALAAVRALLYVCPPNEVLIFSGRDHTTPDGRTVGFRVLHGGRALRIPVLEKVDRMDMRLIAVPMQVGGAYSEGGIPLTVDAIANVKISGDPEVMANAIERFLGHERRDIARVAKETLEGHLRGVVATMTPEEVNEDRLKFARRLKEEAEDDLRKLGLGLDTLKIQAVSDGRGYLDSIGRARIAEVVRSAEVAESDAQRAAVEAEAEASSRAEVAERQAQAIVSERRNALRAHVAQLDAQARAIEEQVQAAADTAKAEAEKDLQTVRAELERLRLRAEVTLPAEADREVKALHAAGEAAAIAETGKATAEGLALVAEAWREAGGDAMELVVLQNLEALFEQVTAAARRVTVDRASLVDGGDGEALGRLAAAYPAAVRALLKEVSTTLGVDLTGTLGDAVKPRNDDQAAA